MRIKHKNSVERILIMQWEIYTIQLLVEKMYAYEYLYYIDSKNSYDLTVISSILAFLDNVFASYDFWTSWEMAL